MLLHRERSSPTLLRGLNLSLLQGRKIRVPAVATVKAVSIKKQIKLWHSTAKSCWNLLYTPWILTTFNQCCLIYQSCKKHSHCIGTLPSLDYLLLLLLFLFVPAKPSSQLSELLQSFWLLLLPVHNLWSPDLSKTNHRWTKHQDLITQSLQWRINHKVNFWKASNKICRLSLENRWWELHHVPCYHVHVDTSLKYSTSTFDEYLLSQLKNVTVPSANSPSFFMLSSK